MCSGYYDYAQGYTPELPGRERFRGQVIHPQQWTPDIDYAGKRVVVIGSGATAVTLVPELAKQAAHVTMLQRSPTYIVSVPAIDPLAKYLPRGAARWKNVLFGMGFYQFCRRYPEQAKRWIIKQTKKRLPAGYDLSHFTPSYNPWDQRLCLVPDADLFKAVCEGKASIVTDHIASFTEGGIQLRQVLHLDHDVELAEPCRPESELASGQPPSRDQPLRLQMAHVARYLIAKLRVTGTRLEVAPHVIDVHLPSHRRSKRDHIPVNPRVSAGSASS